MKKIILIGISIVNILLNGVFCYMLYTAFDFLTWYTVHNLLLGIIMIFLLFNLYSYFKELYIINKKNSPIQAIDFSKIIGLILSLLALFLYYIYTYKDL